MIKWELERITPEIAGQMLAKNDVNRKLREHRCAFLSRAIDEDHWVTTHQGIAFSRSGRLLDGQHRLRAVIMANKAIDVWVARNVPDEAFAVMDAGLQRKMSERIGSDPRRTTIASTLYRLAGPREIPHEYEIKLLLEILEPALNRLDSIPKATKGSRVTKASVLGAAVLRLAGEKPGSQRHTFAIDALEYLFAGDVAKSPKVVVSLYRQLLESTSAGVMEARNVACRTWYATDMDNATVAKITFKDLSTPMAEIRTAFREVTEGVFDN